MNNITKKTAIHLPLTAFLTIVGFIIITTSYYYWILGENNKAHSNLETRVDRVEEQEWDEKVVMNDIKLEIRELRKEISEIKNILINRWN